MRKYKTDGNGACRIVPGEQSRGCDHMSPLELSGGAIMVIFELPSIEGFVVIGCLAEIDVNHITFDYVVLDRTLEDSLHMTGIVLIKRNCDPIAFLERIPCVIVFDSDSSATSFRGLRIRRCVLRRIGL